MHLLVGCGGEKKKLLFKGWLWKIKMNSRLVNIAMLWCCSAVKSNEQGMSPALPASNTLCRNKENKPFAAWAVSKTGARRQSSVFVKSLLLLCKMQAASHCFLSVFARINFNFSCCRDLWWDEMQNLIPHSDQITSPPLEKELYRYRLRSRAGWFGKACTGAK